MSSYEAECWSGSEQVWGYRNPVVILGTGVCRGGEGPCGGGGSDSIGRLPSFPSSATPFSRALLCHIPYSAFVSPTLTLLYLPIPSFQPWVTPSHLQMTSFNLNLNSCLLIPLPAYFPQASVVSSINVATFGEVKVLIFFSQYPRLKISTAAPSTFFLHPFLTCLFLTPFPKSALHSLSNILPHMVISCFQVLLLVFFVESFLAM